MSICSSSIYTQLPLVAVTYYISETIGKQTRVFASMREQYGIETNSRTYEGANPFHKHSL